MSIRELLEKVPIRLFDLVAGDSQKDIETAAHLELIRSLQRQIEMHGLFIQGLEEQVRTVERVSEERLSVIYSVEKQREELRQIWHQETREHLTAQVILEKEIMRARDVATRALALLNKMRKEQDLEPVKSDADIPACDSAPVGAAKAFALRMKALHDALPVPVSYQTPPPASP